MSRKSLLFGFGIVASVLVGAMGAWACTNLATLNLSHAAGESGTPIDITGSSFSAASSGGQKVAIRWNGVEGPVLARVAPDSTGNIEATVKVPADAQPGYYVLVATQNVKDEEGVSPAYGTPARASFLVGTAAPEDVAQPSGVPASIGPEGASGSLVALTAILALLGLGLFGSGLGLFVRELRRRAVPAPVKRK